MRDSFDRVIFNTKMAKWEIELEIIVHETLVQVPIEKSIPSSKQELCLGFLTSIMFRSNQNFRFSMAINDLEYYMQLRICHCLFFSFLSVDVPHEKKRMQRGFYFRCVEFNFPTFAIIVANYSDKKHI